MKTLNLVLGITVTLGAEGLGGGSIESNLKAQGWKENEEFNAGVDMMETLILAHAEAGIDVTAEAYQKGIEVTYETLTNRFDVVEVSYDDYVIVRQELERATATVNKTSYFKVPKGDWERAIESGEDEDDALTDLRSEGKAMLVSTEGEIEDVSMTFHEEVVSL